MEYIHKLPFMLGTFMAIVIGTVSYKFHVSQQDTYIRMAICMIVFYILGVYIKGTIIRIMDEIEKKKEEENKVLEEMEIHKQEELNKHENSINANTPKLDLKIDESYDETTDLGEDFSPLTIREFLKSGNEN